MKSVLSTSARKICIGSGGEMNSSKFHVHKLSLLPLPARHPLPTDITECMCIQAASHKNKSSLCTTTNHFFIAMCAQLVRNVFFFSLLSVSCSLSILAYSCRESSSAWLFVKKNCSRRIRKRRRQRKSSRNELIWIFLIVFFSFPLSFGLLFVYSIWKYDQNLVPFYPYFWNFSICQAKVFRFVVQRYECICMLLCMYAYIHVYNISACHYHFD